MKHLVRIMLAVGACSLLLAGCNSDYNFDKISLEVTIGDTEGITIPLGTTERITVESLLGEQNTLTPNEEGVYSISMSDAITETLNIGTLAPITGLAPTIAPTTIALMGEMGANINPISEQQSIPYPSGMGSGITVPSILEGQQLSMSYGPATFSQNFTLTLPEQIKSIDKVRFGANGSGSKVAITFDLAGVASVSQNRTIKNFTIATPAGFELQKISGDALDAYATLSKSSGSSTNNTYVVSNCPVSGSSITIQFLVMSAELSGSTNDNALTVNTDISYSFEMDYSVKAGTVGSTAPSVKAAANLTIYDATVVLNAWEQNVEFSESISESISLPKEVEAIDYLTIRSSSLASVVPQLNVALGLSGSPMSTIKLSSLELTLPSILDVEAPSGWTLSGNKLTATNLSLANGTNNIISLPLKGLKNIPIVGGKANVEGTIGVKATIGIVAGDKLTVDTSAKQITLTPQVTIDDINIRSIVGRINPDLGGMIEPVEIEIGDLLGSLGKDVELDLNLASPTIDLAVENPIGVGINLAVKIDAWKGGSVVKSITTPTLKIAGAEGATPATTTISLTGDAPKAGQTQVEGLTELINLLPEKLTVTLDVATDNTKAHTLLIQDSYTFKVNYSVGAALKFDTTKDGRISYSMTIDNVDLSSVADVDLVIDTLTVNVDAQSTLPLDALLQIVFLDKDKNEITQIKSLTTGKIEGSKDGTPTSSQTSVGVRLYSDTSSAHFGALLSRVNAIRCTFEGTTLAGAGLKPDQWLQATLSLCLNDGLSVDLGALAEGAGEK